MSGIYDHDDFFARYMQIVDIFEHGLLLLFHVYAHLVHVFVEKFQYEKRYVGGA